MIDIDTLSKLSDKRDKRFNKFIKDLENKLKKYQQHILDKIINDIFYDTDLEEIDDVLVKLNEVLEDDKDYIALLAWYKKEVNSLLELTEEYFQEFDRSIPKETKSYIDNFIIAFISTLSSFKGDITSNITSLYLSDSKPKFKAESFSNRILGTKNRGYIYNKLLPQMRDTALQLVRLADSQTAQKEELTHALYTGLPLTEKSRCFCIERKDKFFSLETVDSWDALEWSGKIYGISVRIVAGGHHCLHSIFYVDQETAEKYGVTTNEELNPC